MRKSLLWLVWIGLFLVMASVVRPDNFGSSLSNDLKRTRPASFKNKPAVPSMGSAASSSVFTKPAAPPQALPIAQTPQIPTFKQTQITPASLPIHQPSLKTTNLESSIMTERPTKITVPDLDAKYQEMFGPKKTTKTQKRSLVDTFIQEVYRYRYLIVLGMIVLVVIFALRKEQENLKSVGAAEEEKKNKKKVEQKPGKRDIWSDEF